MSAYYNEFDPFAAAWLRALIADGLIAPGEVDERSIKDVLPDDLKGFTQCHFFAGIGGWSYALRLAGWSDDRPVWTGSCPCQPLSSAGQRKGHSDERHLWPAFYDLITERRPSVIFGEQVESKDGREWLSGVRTDLEADRYAVGAADLCAAGAGAPHPRQRLYWVAHTNDPYEDKRSSGRQQPVHHANDANNSRMGNAEGETQRGAEEPGNGSGRLSAPRKYDGAAGRSSISDYWRDFEIVECRDGLRRIEPGALPLVDGVPKRMDKLRGYGNAIVAPLAARFIQAADEAMTSVQPQT